MQITRVTQTQLPSKFWRRLLGYEARSGPQFVESARAEDLSTSAKRTRKKSLAARLVLMSGVFLLVENDKNEPHVFAFDPQQQNAHLSGSCLSSHSAAPTSMPVMLTTPDTPSASKITFPTAAGALFRTSSRRIADRMNGAFNWLLSAERSGARQ